MSLINRLIMTRKNCQSSLDIKLLQCNDKYSLRSGIIGLVYYYLMLFTRLDRLDLGLGLLFVKMIIHVYIVVFRQVLITGMLNTVSLHYNYIISAPHAHFYPLLITVPFYVLK